MVGLRRTVGRVVLQQAQLALKKVITVEAVQLHVPQMNSYWDKLECSVAKGWRPDGCNTKLYKPRDSVTLLVRLFIFGLLATKVPQPDDKE